MIVNVQGGRWKQSKQGATLKQGVFPIFTMELRATFFEKCRLENPNFDELNPEKRLIFILNNDMIINDSMNFVYDIFHKRKNLTCN